MDLCDFKYSDTQPYKQEAYTESRVKLLNEWCRKSLRKQTSQNFTFISLWDEIIDDGKLDNEICIRINRTGTTDDEPLDYRALTDGGEGKLTLNYSDQIANKVSELFEPPVIITNLDCDDALHFQFVEKLHKTIEQRDFDRSKPFYFSTSNRFCYNIHNRKKGMKKTASPSPFVSTWEPEIRCFPLRYNHQYLGKWVNGVNVEGLTGLQTVNDTNCFSKGTGQSAEFDLNEFI